MTDRATNRTAIYVLASGEASNGNDRDVSGVYLLGIDADVPPQERAAAALDVFHSSVPVKMPEDFDFRVFEADGTEIHEDFASDGECRLAGRGRVEDRLDVLPFPLPETAATP